ncbi:hypothetical protein VR7878_03809 [Vibrio ruber DSM 16370]|uniref:Uncharacterized protein n=1 Tax=Vibrio ruber (strain DSM 16370 / JCM 11486 / BCRC 17186 / CECT 7878 / LMG 23124 / VR1) TaxID=1123498 RepID=A0A1R4LU32_VIBR1|nr:hypothetical protein [Vibrio ruber]SJN59909.1 hypothetical protein VR7878_03809 [Vibrio ruber DSM 16370]
MALPPYSSNVRWAEYKIDTPTFRLSPVEKPDMSPFLFHMTGRKEILSILSPDMDAFPENSGFLKSAIPEAQGEDRNYTAEVVCLTESPTFCLDFFRYRSFNRWRQNQLFGIGLDKSELAELGARPCIYADEQLKNDLIVIKHRLEEIELQDPVLRERLPSLINRAYPLMMPLLENKASQGFMWEREWRYENAQDRGLVFPYSAIKIICCPENEEEGIRHVLGIYSNNIKFVRSWREYNEVTSYLKNRKREMHVPSKLSYSNDQEYLSALKEQLVNYRSVFNRIEAFKNFIEIIESKGASTSDALHELQQTMDSMIQQIRNIQDKL